MSDVVAKQSVSQLARWWLPIFGLFVIHNLEEILGDMPAWGREHLDFLSQTFVSPMALTAIIIVLSAILFAIAYHYRQNARMTRRLLLLFLVIMIGVFIWHITISLVTQSIQPGVLTAGVFLPIYGFMLFHIYRTKQTLYP